MNNKKVLIDELSLFALSSVEPCIPISKEQRMALDSLLETVITDINLKNRVESIFAYFYQYLGERTRLRLSSIIKSFENNIDLDLSILPIIQSFAEDLKSLDYAGYDSAIILSHDIDYKLDYKSLLWVANIEAQKGLKAAYYFLTNAGYKIDVSLINELIAMGHEIGLHGYYYDLRLAYRNFSTIYSRLSQAKMALEDKLSSEICGFRNHSLILSKTILNVLECLQFQYDSGIYPKKNRNGFNIYYCWPFRYKNKRLFEIPVMWPLDTEMFRTMNMLDNEAFAYYANRIKMIKDFHGVACLDLHPSIIFKHKNFYLQLVEFICDLYMYNDTPKSLIKMY